MCLPWMMSLTLARVPPQAMQVVTLPFRISTLGFPKCDASKQTWPWKKEFKLETAAVGCSLKNEEPRPVLPVALLCGTLALLLQQQHTLAAACPVARTVAIQPFCKNTSPNTSPSPPNPYRTTPQPTLHQCATHTDSQFQASKTLQLQIPSASSSSSPQETGQDNSTTTQTFCNAKSATAVLTPEERGAV